MIICHGGASSSNSPPHGREAERVGKAANNRSGHPCGPGSLQHSRRVADPRVQPLEGASMQEAARCQRWQRVWEQGMR